MNSATLEVKVVVPGEEDLSQDLGEVVENVCHHHVEISSSNILLSFFEYF